MLKLFIRLGLVLLVLNHLFAPCTAFKSFGSRSNSGSKYGKTNKEQTKTNTLVGTSAGLPSQQTTRRGLGISAWGIITVIITMILAGMGFYYFSMCYPMLCKKERNYDMMMATV